MYNLGPSFANVAELQMTQKRLYVTAKLVKFVILISLTIAVSVAVLYRQERESNKHRNPEIHRLVSTDE